MTNCVNCGAILHGATCEYCGTEYKNSLIIADFNKDKVFGELSIGDKKYQVYLGATEIHTVFGGAYRDDKGRLHTENAMRKHKFSLIEV